VHFLYVLPRDGVDRELDTNSAIPRSVASWQAWLRRETRGRPLAVDTFQGEPDVTFFRLAANDAVVAERGPFVREHLEEELFAAGFGSPTKIYAVYYDGTSTWSCGGGDPDPTFRGSFAALYLRGLPPGAPPCASNPLGVTPPGYFEFAMLHEIMHNLGFVPSCAPHAVRDFPAGHVSDSPFDLMWAGNAPWRTDVPDQMRLDVGRDDYYLHGRPGCSDFANNPYLGPPEPVALTVGIAGRGRGRVEIRSGSGVGVTCPPACEERFTYGERVTLRAVPARGSVFVRWNDACSGETITCTINLEQATSVTAHFERRRYAVVVSVRGPGSVRFDAASCSRRCQRQFEHATAVVFRATPRRGARFVGWRGACRGTRVCRLVVTRPIAVTALFGPS
jgi:hypothetical protein